MENSFLKIRQQKTYYMLIITYFRRIQPLDEIILAQTPGKGDEA